MFTRNSREKVKRINKIFEEITEKIPIFDEKHQQAQDAQKNPKKEKKKRFTSTYITGKLTKIMTKRKS